MISRLWKAPTTIQLFNHPLTLEVPLKQMLMLAVGLAMFWWAATPPIIALGGEQVWGDQVNTFLAGWSGLLDPYSVPRFVNAPWAMAILLPFSWLPLPLGVLGQMVIYFCALVLVVFRFSPLRNTARDKQIAVLAVLLSPFALDTGIELNIDWIVAIGLLVPRPLSGPFLLVKPQDALGYVLTFRLRDFLVWVLVLSITFLVSLVIWGTDWPLRLMENMQQYSVVYAINAAPSRVLGWPLAIVLGVLLLGMVVYRRIRASSQDSEPDPSLATYAVLGGICFVPYIAAYSLMLPYALLAALAPRVMFLVTVVVWVALAALLLPSVL